MKDLTFLFYCIIIYITISIMNDRRKNMFNFKISLIDDLQKKEASKTKDRITITIDPDVIKFVDKIKKEYRILKSRSSTIEFIIKRFNEFTKLEKLKERTAKYYKSLTAEEIEEDRIWAEFATKQAKKVWD